MKKFKLLAAMVITVAMLFTVAFAAEVSFDAINYNGTDDTVTVVVKANSALAIDAYSTFAVDYDADVYTVSSMTSSFAAAEIKDKGGRIDWSNPSGDAAIAEGDALLTVVFNVVDKDAAVGTTFGTNETNTFTSAFNAGGDILDMVASVTVEEAAPAVEYEDKDFAVATVAADKSDIVIGEDTYTNVAKYVGVINLDTIKASLQTGETLKAAGIKINNVAKAVFDIAGTGEVDYSILFYGITPAQADALNVATYYTANVIKAN